jgi:protein-S-isoprenylcysteine O-methyltransferase Ste14
MALTPNPQPAGKPGLIPSLPFSDVEREVPGEETARAGSSDGLRSRPWGGKLAYGILFTLVVPFGLWLWNSHLHCSLPAVRSVWFGAPLTTAGAALVLLGMWRLWRDGRGLPMNAFPPPLLVTRGVYALVPHPIYCGFVSLCAGLALLSGSATALWMVTPVAALACVALVLGYEGPDLRRRFCSQLPSPWLGLPQGEGFLPLSRRIGAGLGVLVPWAVCYWAVKTLGVSAGAVETRLDWEWAIPVLPTTMPIYASIYLVVPLTFLLCADRAALRRLVVSVWLVTLLNTLLYLVVPATTTFRPTAYCVSDGGIGSVHDELNSRS